MSGHNPPPPPSEIIEHIVLFKVKPDADESKVTAMINYLNTLSTLDIVLYVTAGQIIHHSSTSSSSSLAFTHMLHARYASKSDLQTYNKHPAHRLATDYVMPVVEELAVVDWVANGVDSNSSPIIISPGSALRVSFFKLKENLGEKEKNEIMEGIGGLKKKFPTIEQLSYGENFSPPEYGKGLSIVALTVFKDWAELEKVDKEYQVGNEENDKFIDYLDDVVVVNYIVPA